VYRKRFALIVFTLVVVGAVFYGTVYRAPDEFVAGHVVRIEQGKTLADIAAKLEAEHIIRSASWFRGVVLILGGERRIIAGDYFFSRKKSLGEVASMLVEGDFGLIPIRVTVFEGFSSVDIAELFAGQFDLFDKEKFLERVEDKEGYLFPDTYFFLPNVDERHVAKVLLDTFATKVETIQEETDAFDRAFDEILIMASILEREARDMESRRIIAGILWKRLEEDIPLQVDVTFSKINGKNSYELTLDDLETDSPFNTYRHKGLPPTPIANPGLDAIRAAVTPIESEYLYFLADREGNIYYSETFEQHKEKKALYLN